MESVKNIKNFWPLIFLPLLLYLGDRSLISTDEGYYALQARWILETGNWLIPQWWGEVTFDRTIGIQFLIALSQKVFGKNEFSISLPTSLAAIINIYLTYKIHREILDKKYSIISPIILSTFFLWINYAHMATQDMIFSSMITFGIYYSLKSKIQKKNIYFFFSGFWIGLAIMMKTYMTVLPIIAILPFWIENKIILRRYFWIGSLLGILPFLFWSYKIILLYGFPVYNGLYEKVLTLSGNNTFTKSTFYYLWNLPLNIFPWSIFSTVGLAINLKTTNPNIKYFLFFYPLTILFLLSIFSTKTPYYPIQILPLLAINTFLGIKTTIENQNIIFKFIKNFHFNFIPIMFIILVIGVRFDFININLDKQQEIFLYISFLTFSIIWYSFNFTKNLKQKLLIIILGPYLLMSLIVQSGLLNDRSKDLRLESERLVKDEKLIEEKIEFVNQEASNAESHSKIIKIALFMPKIGNGIDDISFLKHNQYAWTTSEIILEKEAEYEIITKSKIFKPWKLIKKI
ncbi:ArnT family glycosyltransferase [Prochlorococcus marinus]|uniref:Glycosyltransferase RgtA/B/C/D-like domain-containing protein n=1 Tax=Prochlorococcus marinus (strain MIT 9301) TaxID=167546 RepID=A3PE80_PROM0|nr:glycosyltransferase family 39 protein [Prochlorococcus marinus]ABO18055.1 Hypothetical protein P9301_14321 [Prochlorococcus marinus str. MIT 9301]